jgi:hypothetical protein
MADELKEGNRIVLPVHPDGESDNDHAREGAEARLARTIAQPGADQAASFEEAAQRNADGLQGKVTDGPEDWRKGHRRHQELVAEEHGNRDGSRQREEAAPTCAL